MAFDFKQQKKKQGYLLWVAIVIIVLMIAVLWFGVFRKEEGEIETDCEISADCEEIWFIEEINIDFGVLENPFFEKLNPFEEIPAFEGEIGRENPFLPY